MCALRKGDRNNIESWDTVQHYYIIKFSVMFDILLYTTFVQVIRKGFITLRLYIKIHVHIIIIQSVVSDRVHSGKYCYRLRGILLRRYICI